MLNDMENCGVFLFFVFLRRGKAGSICKRKHVWEREVNFDKRVGSEQKEVDITLQR